MEFSQGRQAVLSRAIRVVTDLQQQEAETYRYWQSRTTAERMAAIDEIIRDGYAAKGIDLHVQRSNRSMSAFNAR